MRNSRSRSLKFERLEDRLPLAGNVLALVHDGILLVVGDGQDNQVEIQPADNGGFSILGTETTVNGRNGPVVFGRGVEHVTVSMNGGNDDVMVGGIFVQSNFSFFGGNGNDRLEINGLDAWHFHGEGNAGNDVFDINFIIQKSAYLYLGTGNDVVASQNLNVGRNLKIFADAGDDTVATEQLRVGRKLELHMNSGNDAVLLADATSVGSRARIYLGDGNDFAGILPGQNGAAASFGSSLSVTGDDGNDSIAFDSNVGVNGRLKASGGNGIDSFQRAGSRFGASGVDNFENFPVAGLNSLIDEVFATLAAAGIGQSDPVEPLSASASSSTLNLAEGDNATAVDTGFVLNGSGTVTGATIRIGNYLPGQETLAFAGIGNITGSFEPGTGVLTMTGAASTSAWQAAIRSVTFQSTSENPVTDLRQFEFGISANGDNATATRDFVITALNDAPSIIANSTSQNVLQNQLPVVIDDLLTVLDPDNTELTSANVQIFGGYVQGEDVLSATDNGITSSFDASTGILTLTGPASRADWQAVLRSVTYSNSANEPTAGEREIRMSITDGTDNGQRDFSVNLQVQNQPNTFEISEGAPDGTVLGSVIADGTFQTPMIYQFNNDQIAPEYLANADDHFSGNLAASVVLIEYMDLQCPGCAAFHPQIQSLKADFPADLLVITRHLPIESVHDNARIAAIYAEAAGRQGMFEEMVDLMFTNQTDWELQADPTSIFTGYATTLGLDQTQLAQDVADPALDDRISRDLNEGIDLGLPGTPTFVLQGNQIPLPPDLATFEASIQNAVDDLDQPFAINRETGEIFLRDSRLLDSVNNSVVNLSVLVVDASGGSEIVNVTINVLV